MPYILFGDNEGDLCPGKITWYDHVIKSSFKVLIFNFYNETIKTSFQEKFNTNNLLKIRTFELENLYHSHSYWDTADECYTSSSSDSDGDETPKPKITKTAVTLCNTEGLVYDFLVKHPTIDDQKTIIEALKATKIFSKNTIQLLQKEFQALCPKPTPSSYVPLSFLYHDGETTQKERDMAFYRRHMR